MNIRHKMHSLFIRESRKAECHTVLVKWNTYYKKLSETNKKSFVVRTLMFLDTTYFDSKKGFNVTLEMKLVISSAFVQITFGLKQDALNIFNNIFITPSSYSYKTDGRLFDGDVNPITQRVNLSWPAIEKGFVIDDDGINLAIHEFGHCLILENSRRSYLSRIFKEQKLNAWKKTALEKISAIRNGDSTIFRKYGGSNLMELFSVCLETFFEQPREFYAQTPELYFRMVEVLKQDPRNVQDPKEVNQFISFS